MPAMRPDPDPDDVRTALISAASIAVAVGVDDALRAAVEVACELTGSSRGLAGLFDGSAATSDAWYDRTRGWTAARLRWEIGQGGPGRVCSTKTPLLGNDVPAATLGLEEATEVLDLGSFACVPLLDRRGDALGFLEVGDRQRTYLPQDARRLAALAALAAHRLIETAGGERRRVAEMAALADVAERLQRRLLPAATPPQLPGVDISYAFRSASTAALSGGDFIDYYMRPPSSGLAFAIGDVAGKGVDAMAATFVAKYVLRSAVHGGLLSWPTRPGEALQELRNGLLEQPDFGPESERFITLLFGQLDPRRGLLQLANAGHPAPFLVREAEIVRPLLVTEPAIGVELGASLEPYPTESLTMAPGDLLVMFTDGITELRNSRGDFFEDHMHAALEGVHGGGATAAVDRLLAAAQRFSARPPSDDLAVLCVGCAPLLH